MVLGNKSGYFGENDQSDILTTTKEDILVRGFKKAYEFKSQKRHLRVTLKNIDLLFCQAAIARI